MNGREMYLKRVPGATYCTDFLPRNQLPSILCTAPLDWFGIWVLSLSLFPSDGLLYCLYLRGSEEPRLVDCAVALAAVDQIYAEQGFASVDDLIAEALPACPGLHVLRDARCSLGLFDALGVDRLGFGAQPCSVQSLGKAHADLAEVLPRPGHDLAQVIHCDSSLVFSMIRPRCRLEDVTFPCPMLTLLPWPLLSVRLLWPRVDRLRAAPVLIARFLHLLALLLGSSLRFLPGASLNLVTILYHTYTCILCAF